MGLPDTQVFPWMLGFRQSMILMLTGDSLSGVEAVTKGWATFNFLEEALGTKTLTLARRIALIPSDLQQYNKRSVHRAMEAMGYRVALRAGTDLQSLSFSTETSRKFMKKFSDKASGIKEVFLERDEKFSRL